MRTLKRLFGIGSGSGFVSQVVPTVGTAVFLNFLGLLTGVMAARLLGPVGRGELAAIQLWGTFVATPALVGLPDAVVYFSSRSPKHAGQYWFSGTCFALITGLPIVLGGHLLLPWVLSSQSSEVVVTTRWYSMGLFFLFALSWMPLSALRGLQRVAEWNVLRTLPNFAWLLILTVGFIFNNSSPRFLAFGFLAAYAVASVPILLVSFRRVPGPYLPNIKWWPSMVQYGLPLMLSFIPTYLIQNGRLSQIFIAAFLEPQALGFFAVAVAWSRLTSIAPQAIGQITFARAAAGIKTAAQAKEITKGTRTAVLSIAVISGASFILSPVAIPLLFGNTFAPAVPVAMVMVLAGAVGGLKRVLSDGLRGLGRPQVVLVGETVGISLTGLLLLILLGTLGTTGAAIAILIGEAMAVVLLLRVVTRSLNVSTLTLLLPTIDDLRPITRILGQVWAMLS